MSGTEELAFAETLLRGDHGKAEALSAGVPDRIEALGWLRALEGDAGPAPPPDACGELASFVRMRASLLAHDRAALGRLAAVAPTRVATLARGWARALAGEQHDEAQRETADDALGLALRVESLVLSAWSAFERDEDARALGLVREAASLASRADQPHAQYLAYAALARARRRMGRVPMATRLYGSLLRSAPRAYTRWLAWDARLVGLTDARSPEVDALAQVLASARAGDRVRFEHALAACLSIPDAHEAFRTEARAIATALDPASDLAAADPRARAFASGDRADLLGGLEGVAVDPQDPEAPLAFVLVSERASRRVLAPGLALASASGRPPARIEVTERGGRTETAIVTLVAHPAGLDEDAFFRAVYGFTFKKAIHDGVLRVLLTRMRQALEPHASLSRDGERLRLVVSAPFSIVDPRVASRADNVVLRAIAAERTVSAKDVAERTGLPLRTVQAELARLLDEGVCTRTKDGRSTEYAVEDTVVREPTRVITGVTGLP